MSEKEQVREKEEIHERKNLIWIMLAIGLIVGFFIKGWYNHEWGGKKKNEPEAIFNRQQSG